MRAPRTLFSVWRGNIKVVFTCDSSIIVFSLSSLTSPPQTSCILLLKFETLAYMAWLKKGCLETLGIVIFRNLNPSFSRVATSLSDFENERGIRESDGWSKMKTPASSRFISSLIVSVILSDSSFGSRVSKLSWYSWRSKERVLFVMASSIFLLYISSFISCRYLSSLSEWSAATKSSARTLSCLFFVSSIILMVLIISGRKEKRKFAYFFRKFFSKQGPIYVIHYVYF